MDAEKLIWAEMGEQAQMLGRAGVAVESWPGSTGERTVFIQACELHEVRYWEEERARYTLVRSSEGHWDVVDTLLSEILPGWRGVTYMSEESHERVSAVAQAYVEAHPEAGLLAARVVRRAALERARERGESAEAVRVLECALLAVELSEPGERQLALELLEGRFRGEAQELGKVVAATMRAGRSQH